MPETVREGPQVLLGHADDLRQLGAAGPLRWVGYLSSTSVYGDWGGAWVDERCGPGGRWRGARWRVAQQGVACERRACRLGRERAARQPRPQRRWLGQPGTSGQGERTPCVAAAATQAACGMLSDSRRRLQEQGVACRGGRSPGPRPPARRARVPARAAALTHTGQRLRPVRRPRGSATQPGGARRSELRVRGGRGAPRARAEAAWLALHAEHGLPVHAFRLGGARRARARG